LATFNKGKVNWLAVHDGPTGPLYDILVSHNVDIMKINKNSNHDSLITCLNEGKALKNCDNIYFVEDDYLHRAGALAWLMDGLDLSYLVSLYDHPDRYTRTDDLDYLRTEVLVGKVSHWRTAESTTCTWAARKDMFDDKIYDTAIRHALNDRAMFRDLFCQAIRLITPIPGVSTHCHEPFLSPLW